MSDATNGENNALALLLRRTLEEADPFSRVALSSELTERLRFAQRAGLQYGTKRYVYKVAGYPAQGEVDFDDYWARYDRQDIASRVVDMPARTTWRNPPEILEKDANGDPIEGETPFTRAVLELIDRVNLWSALERVDRLSGIGRYGVLLLGFRAGSDQELRLPARRMRGVEDLLFLTPRAEGGSTISKWDADPTSEHFGTPEVYKIQLSSGMSEFPQKAIEVHRSRVIHVAEDCLEDEVFGRPRLKNILNLLHDLEKITAASGEAYWQLADRILMASIDPDAKVSPNAREALGEALEEMMHDLRRQLVAQGLDMKWLESTPPDPRGAAELCMMLIGAARGIPYRLLFGNTTGERASSEDQKTWLGSIAERIERHASPNILRPFLDRMIEVGVLPRPTHGYLDVWPTLWETPEIEVAERNAAIARAAKDLTPVGADPLALIEIDEDGLIHLVPRLVTDPSPFELEPRDEFGVAPGTPRQEPQEEEDDDELEDGDE